jgi:flagellar hook-basal body complex protein FliE
MAIQAIANVLQQMQVSALQASGQSTDVGATQGGDFATEMKAAINRISDSQNTANSQAEKLELGVPGASINDTMVDLQKSTISLQMGVQVRNKLINAYSEVMNMSV